MAVVPAAWRSAPRVSAIPRGRRRVAPADAPVSGACAGDRTARASVRRDPPLAARDRLAAELCGRVAQPLAANARRDGQGRSTGAAAAGPGLVVRPLRARG